MIIAFRVSKGKNGRKVSQEGTVIIPDVFVWESDALHEEVRTKVAMLYPGWDIVGYSKDK
jgi:hypothetical protein